MIGWLFYCISFLTLTSIQAASIKYFPGLNQVYNVVQPKTDTTTIKYLGTVDTPALCGSACESYQKSRCWSFTHHATNSSSVGYRGQCFGLVAPRWSPTPDDESIVSGVIEWPCRSDDDCSLNGVCQRDGTCLCREAWSGRRCESLNVLPTTRDAGYHAHDDGHNTSSWGGAVLQDKKGVYHMWAAEMTEHCGIGAWAQNSRIIHASSTNPLGPYQRQDVTFEVFSHEPEVVPGPNGEYVMYYTAQLRSEHGDCNCCQQGVSLCDGSTGPRDCPSTYKERVGDSDPSYMSYAANPSGPWSPGQQIFKGYEGSDTNFAPLIFPNGSLVAIWREWTNRGSRCYLATASDWKDASTYKQYTDKELFPDLGTAGTEDPFLYIASDGTIHAVFHHMYGYDTENQWWLDAVGGHAFSRDGVTWTYSGVAWGDPTTTEQGNLVEFTDGSHFRFTRLERPHLIFNERGDITHLISAAQYGEGKNPGSFGDNGDASYTLVQPVKNRAKN